MVSIGARDTLIRIERPVATGGIMGAGQEQWTLVGEEWAQVQDVRPSRDERAADGASIATRRTRIIMPYRDDVTSDMRIVTDSRVMQIVGGPAMLGRYREIEIMAEDYRPAGGASANQ